MPSEKVRGGLYWSSASKSWHYEVRIQGKKHNGDTGIGSSRFVAVEWLKRFKEGKGKDRVGLTHAPLMTLGAALEQWEMAHTGILSKNYVFQMGHLIRTYLKPHLGWPVDQLDTPAMEQARKTYLSTKAKLKNGGTQWEVAHTEGGANTFLKMVNALYGWLSRSRGLRQRPYTLDRLKPQEVPEPVVWPEQVQAFLVEVDRGAFLWCGKTVYREREDDQKLAIRLQLGLGLREGEALGLKWEWIRWRDGVYQPGKTKNRRTREVPIPVWLLRVLEARWKAAGRPAAGLVMPSDLGAPHSRGYTLGPVADSGLAIGITGLHPHRLRATFATAHYEAGTTLADLQQMMGHKDPQTTLGYIVMRPKSAAAAQDKVAASMGFTADQQSPSSPPTEGVARSA